MTHFTKRGSKRCNCEQAATQQSRNDCRHFFFFFKLGFTPCKAEQPLQGMELQEKEAQKD